MKVETPCFRISVSWLGSPVEPFLRKVLALVFLERMLFRILPSSSLEFILENTGTLGIIADFVVPTEDKGDNTLSLSKSTLLPVKEYLFLKLPNVLLSLFSIVNGCAITSPVKAAGLVETSSSSSAIAFSYLSASLLPTSLFVKCGLSFFR